MRVCPFTCCEYTRGALLSKAGVTSSAGENIRVTIGSTNWDIETLYTTTTKTDAGVYNVSQSFAYNFHRV